MPNTPTLHFDRLRARWSQSDLRAAATTTYLAKTTSIVDAEQQLQMEGRASVVRMQEAGVLRPDQMVCELGCGCGRVATALTAYLTAGRYIGIDLSPEYLNLCRQRCPRGEFKLTNGWQIPLPDASVDLVVEFAVFCHMPLELIWLWLRECQRVLRPSGRVYLQFHNLTSDHQWEAFRQQAENWKFLEDPGYSRAVTAEAVSLLMHKAGLAIVDWQEVDRDDGGPRSWFVVASLYT